MMHQPTAADRIGASLNLCFEHDKLVAASSRVLAAALEGAPPAELKELRAARDKQEAALARFKATTIASFTPKSLTPLQQYAANERDPGQAS